MACALRRLFSVNNAKRATYSYTISRQVVQIGPISDLTVPVKESPDPYLHHDYLDIEQKSVLAPTEENLSDYVRNIGPTFNFAPFVNKSPVLRDLIKLGVDLYTIEQRIEAFNVVINLDYEKDFKKHVMFLSDYVEVADLGRFFTKNPEIFKESIEDMQVRINYLQSKNFTKEMIKRIISRNPCWLNFSTKKIDMRLGWFQEQFQLNGHEVRRMSVNEPRVVTYSLSHVETNKFSVLEEMGFEKNECKKLLVNHPRLWMLRNKNLIDRFVYIHNTMKIPHEILFKMPTTLYCRTKILRNRHTFLEKIGRAQYNPKETNYIPLDKITRGTDAQFCLDVAKCSVTEYNAYLKST